MIQTSGKAARSAQVSSQTTGWPEVEPEWPSRIASGARATACATMSSVSIGPNSASISATSWPASISGPPIDKSPSGGSCSRGIRLPIDGCGGLIRRMRIGGLLGKHREHDRQAPAHGAEHRRQQVELAVARRQLPATALVAAKAVERDALAGERAAVEVE